MSITVLAAVIGMAAGCSAPEPPELVPEATDFTETSRYDDVMEVVDYARQHADNMHYEVFAQSEQGRDLPLLVFSDRVVSSPQQARDLSRPVVFIVANIHSGEVEGKEALLRLILELTAGEHTEWLGKVTLALAPIYNADGNEMIDREHRTNQWGPSGGVGTRPNAEGLNLNRDFTKLDTSEGQGLVQNVLATWDPMLFMDLHTTNGSPHGYHLTYAEPLNPNTDPMIREFMRGRMLPEIRSDMQEKGWQVFDYGNFYRGPEQGWFTYSHMPRYSSNYHGLRNRLGLLSETYAYVDYESRIDVVEDFVKETVAFMSENAVEIQAMKQVLDANYTEHADSLEAGISFDYTQVPAEFPVLIADLDTMRHDDLERNTYMRMGIADTVSSLLYNEFRATESRSIPFAYALDNRSGDYDHVVENLRMHGITTVSTSNGDPVPVRRFAAETFQQEEDAYEGHRLVTVEGAFRDEEVALDDWVIIPTNNSNRQLIFYLLEPESDDGYVKWGLFNQALESGDSFPVVKVPSAGALNLE
ncbi:MAG: M14 family metallopeptidase [Balneolaceae bacterium]|nr:M14 family metallopeptidase [Balneolaceae bacterium]